MRTWQAVSSADFRTDALTHGARAPVWRHVDSGTSLVVREAVDFRVWGVVGDSVGVGMRDRLQEAARSSETFWKGLEEERMEE